MRPCRRIYWDAERNWVVIDNNDKKDLFKELTDPNLLAIKTKDMDSLKNAVGRQLENYGFIKIDLKKLKCSHMKCKIAYHHPLGYNPLKHEETEDKLYEAYDQKKNAKKVKTDKIKEHNTELLKETRQLRMDKKVCELKIRELEEEVRRLRQQIQFSNSIQISPIFETPPNFDFQPAPFQINHPPPPSNDMFNFGSAL